MNFISGKNVVIIRQPLRPNDTMRMSLLQKCTIALLGIGIFGGAAYVARIVFRPEKLAKYESIPRVEYVHPNIKKLKKAQTLVTEGKLNEARAILVNALVTSPKSPVTRELRDLLGDVNTQIFFSKEPSPRKKEYTVKSGDALASIARKLQSTADAIIRVNDLESTLIRPGEKLLVPQLDFTITIERGIRKAFGVRQKRLHAVSRVKVSDCVEVECILASRSVLVPRPVAKERIEADGGVVAALAVTEHGT